MASERVLITVKTYPTLSRKYGETVCTAGIREDGSWVRIYPVPFRRLGEAQQYEKYDWVESDLIQSRKDCYRRPDSPQFWPVRFPQVGRFGRTSPGPRRVCRAREQEWT